MKFSQAIDQYIRDMRMYGRINSDATETAYRSRLDAHCDDVNNRDPRKTGREDVKTTLRRWNHPNTQRTAHAILTSFYDWCMEEGLRDTNPSRQVRRAKRRATAVYRLTRHEAVRLLDLPADQRTTWVLHLGLLAGIRSQELRGLQAHHFSRPGFVWIDNTIGKGNKERWIPVLPELAPIVSDITRTVRSGDYVFCQRQITNPPRTGTTLRPDGGNTTFREIRDKAMSPRKLFDLVRDAGQAAGIAHPIGPHSLRHAFGDHVARYAGLRAAQALLGHADVSTTEGTYTGEVSLDELAVSVHGFAYRELSPQTGHQTPLKAPTGFEPVVPALRQLKPLPGPLTAYLTEMVPVYQAAFAARQEAL